MSTQTNTVLITGSSNGIDLDIARALPDRGANVVLNGRNPDKLTTAAENLGPRERFAAVPGSIAERKTAEAMVRLAVERFGRVDVLVNNAVELEAVCRSHRGGLGRLPLVAVQLNALRAQFSRPLETASSSST